MRLNAAAAGYAIRLLSCCKDTRCKLSRRGAPPTAAQADVCTSRNLGTSPAQVHFPRGERCSASRQRAPAADARRQRGLSGGRGAWPAAYLLNTSLCAACTGAPMYMHRRREAAATLHSASKQPAVRPGGCISLAANVAAMSFSSQAAPPAACGVTFEVGAKIHMYAQRRHRMLPGGQGVALRSTGEGAAACCLQPDSDDEKMQGWREQCFTPLLPAGQQPVRPGG